MKSRPLWKPEILLHANIQAKQLHLTKPNGNFKRSVFLNFSPTKSNGFRSSICSEGSLWHSKIGIRWKFLSLKRTLLRKCRRALSVYDKIWLYEDVPDLLTERCDNWKLIVPARVRSTFLIPEVTSTNSSEFCWLTEVGYWHKLALRTSG